MKYLPGEQDNLLYHLARGILLGIEGHPLAGIKHLVFSDGKRIAIESGYGVRNLARYFGASEGKGDLQNKIRNQDIYYSVDALGVLEWFLPAAEWKGKEMLIGEEEWLPEEGFPKNEI